MADTAKSSINFKALQLANEQRSAYGLRYNDYARYRKHCANRTHRLRSTLKMTHGKGREFKKLPVLTAENIKDGHLQLLLLEAERAWAYSQELTAQSLNPANEDKAHALRHSATGRFRRAVHWSTQLLSHCQSLHSVGRLSADSLLQVEVYELILNGRFLRYKDEFEDAVAQLSVARGLLDELANTASTSRDQALATLFSDEIGPEIRYCAHELGRAKAYDIDGIVAEYFGQHKNELVDGCDNLVHQLKVESQKEGNVDGRRRKLDVPIWEGAPVPVRNPELVDVLLKVQEAEGKLEQRKGANEEAVKAGAMKKNVAAYDAILLALSDAEEVGRKLVEAQQASGGTSTSASGTRDIHFVHAYIVYQLLSRRIQRDLLLVASLLATQSSHKKQTQSASAKTKAERVDSRLYPAVVKLLDTILQSLDQMRTLSIVDDSPDLASAVESRLSFTKARRCLFLSRCYAPVKKYAEALTLIQHANIHLREARSHLSLILSVGAADPTDPFYPLPQQSISDLESVLAADALHYKNDWFAYNGGSIDKDPKTFKKPLFFDIALNYVSLDMERLRERAGKAPARPAPLHQPVPVPAEKKMAPISKARIQEEVRPATPEPHSQPAKGGLSSLLGGWWGRS